MKPAIFLIVMAALGAWTVRSFMAERSKSD